MLLTSNIDECKALALVIFAVCASPQGCRRPNFKDLATDQARYQRWLLKNETKAFYTPVFAEDIRQGTQYLLQVGISTATKVLALKQIQPMLLWRISLSVNRKLLY